MTRVIWTPEDGWTDGGLKGRVVVDDKGRIVFVPDNEEEGEA